MKVIALLCLIVLFTIGCAPTVEPAPAPVPAPLPTPAPKPEPLPTPSPQLVPPPEPEPCLIEAQVIRVINGDTIEVDIDGKLYRVRYIGIDTPEVGQPCSSEATQKNRDLVEGKVVWLEKDISETDKYDRLLRYVYVENIFVNAELVHLGYAQVITYPPDVKYQDHFLQLQREAKEAQRGCWKEEPVRPPKTTGIYVGSINSNIYHYPDCRYAQRIKPENEIWFSSPEDAKAHGYRPCKVCKPPS